MSGFDAFRNLGQKATRRLLSAHKPVVRAMRRHARAEEHRAVALEAAALDREIAAIARGHDPIVAGPWLAEVGYEVLYWIPFLRWFTDTYAVRPDRLVVLSRGGMEAAYRDLTTRYVDLFDLLTPEALAGRNAERRAEAEGGGQKQSAASRLDEELLAATRARLGLSRAGVCHPSLMFRLFRHVWHGNLPYDVLWRHTRYATASVPGPRLDLPGVPAGDFIAVKMYEGPALSADEATRRAVRAVVARAAEQMPVVLLDTDLRIDEHRDFALGGLPGVTSARSLMQARSNLGVQIQIIARSRAFLGTCGGLAWLAPFLGVPVVAVYDRDHLLAPHLFVARQAGAAVRAAPFTTLDLRALAQVGLFDATAIPRPSPAVD